MQPLEEFERKLGYQIGRATELRPFVCDGSPLDCQVLLVGYNPATSMKEDFWFFWDAGIGFNKAKWLRAYSDDRVARGKPPLSNSRRVMKWIGEAAGAIGILETNLFWTPSKRKNDLSPAAKARRDFDFVLDELKPSVIVLHGNDAHKHFQGINTSAAVIQEKHFAIGFSRDKATKLGKRIAGIVEGQ